MAIEDRFGLPLTAASGQAARDYIDGLDLLLSSNIGAEALFERALAADPLFALAHIARARLWQVGARMAEAKAAAAAARALGSRVTPRERSHIETIGLVIDGAPVAAMARLEAHIAEYPRDALVLSLALGVFGLVQRPPGLPRGAACLASAAGAALGR